MEESMPVLSVLQTLFYSLSFSRVGGWRGTGNSLDLPARSPRRWFHRIVLFHPPLPEPCLLLS